MDSWLAAINKANRRDVVRKHSRINLAFKKKLTIKKKYLQSPLSYDKTSRNKDIRMGKCIARL